MSKNLDTDSITTKHWSQLVQEEKVYNLSKIELQEKEQYLAQLRESINEPEVTEFHFMRHGHTNWDPTMIALGPQDLSINEKGVTTVIDTATKKLSHVHIDYVISSHLKRATETKDLVLKTLNLDYKVEIDHSLEERNYGTSSQSKTDKIVEVLDNAKVDGKLDYKKLDWKKLTEITESDLPKDAEHHIDFVLRLAQSIDGHLHNTNSDQTPLIVSHGCVRAEIMKLMDLDPSKAIGYGDSATFRYSDVDHSWGMYQIPEQEIVGNNTDTAVHNVSDTIS